MHDRPHLPMSPAEAASLRSSSPVDEALLQRIRIALVGKDVNDDTNAAKPAAADRITAEAGGAAPNDDDDGGDTAAEAPEVASQDSAGEPVEDVTDSE